MKKTIILILIGIFAFLSCANGQKRNSGNDYSDFEKASELLKEDENSKEARNLLSEQLKRTPDHIDSYMMLAGMENRIGNYSRALQLLNTALDKNNRKSGVTDEIIHWFKGNIYESMEDYEKSILELEKALKRADRNCPDAVRSIQQDLANCLYRNKDLERSDEVYETMLNSGEGDQVALVGLARNQIERDKCAEALETLERCSRLDDRYYETYRFKAYAYSRIGEKRKAVDNMLDCFILSEDPDLVSFYILSAEMDYSVAKIKELINRIEDNRSLKILLTDLYEKDHDYANAILIYNMIEKEYGSSPSMMYYRARDLNRIGLFQDAAEELTRCTEMEEPHYSVFAERGYSHENMGDYRKAILDYKQVIELSPTYAYGYYRTGLCYEMIGDLKQAMHYYNMGISIDPDYAYTYLMRGSLHMKEGDGGSANHDFESILQIDTTANGGSCRHFALLYLEDADKAEEWLEKVISNNPKDPGNYYDLACIRSLAGRKDGAIDALRKALELGFRRITLIEQDNDLDSIRDDEAYKELIRKYRNILKAEEEKMHELVLPDSGKESLQKPVIHYKA